MSSNHTLEYSVQFWAGFMKDLEYDVRTGCARAVGLKVWGRAIRSDSVWTLLLRA